MNQTNNYTALDRNSETSNTDNSNKSKNMDTSNSHPSCNQSYTEVKLRNKRPQTNQEKSETQRKRNSKNRLSNRRSTGFVTPEEIEKAMSMQESL